MTVPRPEQLDNESSFDYRHALSPPHGQSSFVAPAKSIPGPVPPREASIGSLSRKSGSAEARVRRHAPPEERQYLELDRDEILESKAFVWASGRNADGELALSTTTKAIPLPKCVRQLCGFPVKEIVASNNHTAVLTPLGEVHVAGSSLHGKLGILGIEKKALNKFHACTQLAGLQGSRVIQVCCGDYMTLLLVATSGEGRKVYCLGGQNTKATRAQDANELAEIGGELAGRDVAQIACGDFHGAAVDSLGCLFTWGGGKSA